MNDGCKKYIYVLQAPRWFSTRQSLRLYPPKDFFFIIFFFYTYLNMPPKTPLLPRVPNMSHKSKASCVCPRASLKHPTFSEYLDLPSVTALHAFESCIYIFFFLLYDKLFSSSSPQVLRILSPFQKVALQNKRTMN